jgi:hypothetical protein
VTSPRTRPHRCPSNRGSSGRTIFSQPIADYQYSNPTSIALLHDRFYRYVAGFAVNRWIRRSNGILQVRYVASPRETAKHADISVRSCFLRVISTSALLCVFRQSHRLSLNRNRSNHVTASSLRIKQGCIPSVQKRVRDISADLALHVHSTHCFIERTRPHHSTPRLPLGLDTRQSHHPPRTPDRRSIRAERPSRDRFRVHGLPRSIPGSQVGKARDAGDRAVSG